MKRSLLMIVALVGLGLGSGNPAMAQGRGGLNSGWGGVDLLLHPLVQKDLKLETQQIQEVRNLSDQLLDRQKVIFSKLEGLSGEARTKMAHDLATEHAQDGMKAVETILKPDQFQRFRQIDLQQRGAMALVDPEVAKSLEISSEQTGQIHPILDRSILQMREALSSTRGDRRASTEKIQAIRNQTNAQAIACLTEAQKVTWNQMTGPTIDLNPASRPRSK